MTNRNLASVFFIGCVFALWFILMEHTTMPHWAHATMVTILVVAALFAVLFGSEDNK